LQTLKGGKPLKAKKATPSVDFDLAGTSTKVNVHTDKSVDMHTNVQIAQGTMPAKLWINEIIDRILGWV
jgi:hypothetical protein